MTTLAPRDPSHRPRTRTDAGTRGPTGPAGSGPAGPAGSGPGRAAGPDATPGPLAARGGPEAERLRRLTAGFAQAFLEVECGRRPRGQLRPVLCPRLADRLADIWLRPGPPGRVVHAYGSRVAADRFEGVAVVRRGERFGALAVSLAYTGSCWRVVDAARPEDGPVSQDATADDGEDARGDTSIAASLA